MILCLAATFLWATHDPDRASGQSSELMEAYNSFIALYQQGRYSEAGPYAKEALRLATEEFGPNDPSTAIDLNNLALLYEAQGHYAEAEPLYKRALAIDEKALGPENPAVAQSLMYKLLRVVKLHAIFVKFLQHSSLPDESSNFLSSNLLFRLHVLATCYHLTF